jgi:hypothetical protein
MSNRLVSLKASIEILRRHFLPASFNPLGEYLDNRRVQAHTRAFLVLCHAEFESYFEEWAREIARASEQAWKTKSRLTPPLSFLLSSNRERLELPETVSGAGAQDGPRKLADLVVRLFAQYYKKIKENHGIREKNIVGLFSPLGIPSSAFAPTLLPNLDALGADRGDHAHHSAKAVTSVLDPEAEYKRIQDIIGDLDSFDVWSRNYRRKIR